MNVPPDGFNPIIKDESEVVTNLVIEYAESPISSGLNTRRLNAINATIIIIPECLNPEENLPFAINPAMVPLPIACIVTP